MSATSNHLHVQGEQGRIFIALSLFGCHFQFVTN